MLVIDFDEDSLKQKIQTFCNPRLSDHEIRHKFFPKKSGGKYLVGDTRDWELAEARKKIQNNEHEMFMKDIDYRPFDMRKIYYSPDMVDWGRETMMEHFLLGENVGLVFKRGFTENAPPVFISGSIVDFRFWSRPRMQGGDYVAPLYLYQDEVFQNGTKKSLPTKTLNLNDVIVSEIAQRLGLRFVHEKEATKKTFAPIDILDYIYAVLHSPAYRERYKEFLKIDFPRVPYPEDAKSFWRLVKLGEKLRHLHLMEGVAPLSNVATFPVAGMNDVEKLEYVSGRVLINATQYFDNVSSEVWNFYIGGYQPAQKWLKDRKGRTLNFDDIQHYQKIVAVLTETILIQEEMLQ
jgi:predicted helicase